MLYKHLFSILCGHLNLNQKRKKFEFGRLPVKPTGKPVKPTGTLVRTVCTMDFEFKFDFDRFGPVSGQTGPVLDPAGLAGPVGSVNPGGGGRHASVGSPAAGRGDIAASAAAAPRRRRSGHGGRRRTRR